MMTDLPNGVVSAKTDPVGNGAVLLHFLAENALDLERLVRRLKFEEKLESVGEIMGLRDSEHSSNGWIRA